MDRLEKTPENILAYLSYKLIKDNGSMYESNELFNSTIEKQELVNNISNSELISAQCMKRCHQKLNSEQKLLLLDKFINNDNLLEEFLTSYYVNVTLKELQILIPHIVNNVPTLHDALLQIKDINDLINPKFIKSMKFNKETVDKLNQLAIAHKLKKGIIFLSFFL